MNFYKHTSTLPYCKGEVSSFFPLTPHTPQQPISFMHVVLFIRDMQRLLIYWFWDYPSFGKDHAEQILNCILHSVCLH